MSCEFGFSNDLLIILPRNFKKSLNIVVFDSRYSNFTEYKTKYASVLPLGPLCSGSFSTGQQRQHAQTCKHSRYINLPCLFCASFKPYQVENDKRN